MGLGVDAEAQLDGFIDKFTPEVASLTRALMDKMKARVPGATIMVYDNYNALAIGFGPTDRAGQAVFSLAVMPRWVTLCFNWGVRLPDPHGLLNGSGNQVRHVRLHTPPAFDDPGVVAVIDSPEFELEVDQADADRREHARQEVVHADRHVGDVVHLVLRRPAEAGDMFVGDHRVAERVVLVIIFDDRSGQLGAFLDPQPLRQRSRRDVPHHYLDGDDLDLPDQLLAHVDSADEMGR